MTWILNTLIYLSNKSINICYKSKIIYLFITNYSNHIKPLSQDYLGSTYVKYEIINTDVDIVLISILFCIDIVLIRDIVFIVFIG